MARRKHVWMLEVFDKDYNGLLLLRVYSNLEEDRLYDIDKEKSYKFFKVRAFSVLSWFRSVIIASLEAKVTNRIEGKSWLES